MSDKINNSEIDYSDNHSLEQIDAVELTNNTDPIEQVAALELTSHAEPIEQVAALELTSPSEPIEEVAAEESTIYTDPIEQVAPVELTSNNEPVKPIIEEKLHETIEPIKKTIDLEPTEIIISPNNIEPNNVYTISGSDDVIKAIKATSMSLEKELKQETLVSTIELEEVNNNKTQCCFFFQYPKWRK